MQIHFTPYILGLLTGAVIALAFSIPRVGRVLSAMVGTGLVVGGVGFLTWAIAALIGNEELRPVSWQQLYIASPAEAFGLGAGLLVGGVLAVILALRGGRTRQHPSAGRPPLNL